jgi:hypothetical protein
VWKMRFGRGFWLSLKRAWGSDLEGVEVSCWTGSVLRAGGRWCEGCTSSLSRGEFVTVVEDGEKIEFYHSRCLPLELAYRAMVEG